MKLFLHEDNLRDIQVHLTLFLAELSILKTHFFPCIFGKWNKINPENRRSGTYSIIRNLILNFIRPSASKVYNINDAIDIKLITTLLLGFSHLREHKFKHNFRDTLNPLFSCSIEVESTSHYFLRCHFFDALRAALMNDLRNIDSDLPTIRDKNLTNILLYRNHLLLMDLSKAFDCIPHDRLLAKLAAYGVDKNLLCYIYSYLLNRKQCV